MEPEKNNLLVLPKKEVAKGINTNKFDNFEKSFIFQFNADDFAKFKSIENMGNGEYNVSKKRTKKPVTIKEADIAMENDKILEKYMDMINQDRRDMEKRLLDDRKENEARLNSTVERIEQKIDNLESKYDLKFEQMSTKIDSNNKFILGISISTILGIAAIVITVLLK